LRRLTALFADTLGVVDVVPDVRAAAEANSAAARRSFFIWSVPFAADLGLSARDRLLIPAKVLFFSARLRSYPLAKPLSPPDRDSKGNTLGAGSPGDDSQ
jgi:hypothetical protein